MPDIIGILFYITILIMSYLTITSIASAHPILPTEFYGRVISYNNNASSGIISVYINNQSCGTFNIVNTGYYGVLSCRGTDSDSSSKTGGSDGDIVTFKFNGNPTSVFGDHSFNSASFKFVNITYPEIVCGDNFCDMLENCVTCPSDCFVCNTTGNNTGNNTGNQSNNGTGGNGGNGGTGGGSGGGGNGAGGAGRITIPPEGTAPASCVESWQCSNWTLCSPIGVQSRSCYDINGCGSYTSKPLEVMECVYAGNCFDNLINCHDGMCEEGVDCGGPCDKKCSVQEQPFQNITIRLPSFEIPTKICEKHINIKDIGLWLFILIILIAIGTRILYTKYKIKKLKKNEAMVPLDRAKKIFSEKRKTMLFSVSLLFLAIASLLYSYFFLLCPNIFFNYSWILLMMLVLIPLIIQSIMRKLQYSEAEDLSKQKKLEDVHYQNIIKMIELENNMLADEENTIANKFYELSSKEDFRTLTEKHPEIKNIYKDIVDLYTKYREHKNPYELEKDFIDSISILNNDVVFNKELAKYPDLKIIFDRLSKLYSQYEEKQKLYDKLDELENEADAGNKKSEIVKPKNT